MLQPSSGPFTSSSSYPESRLRSSESTPHHIHSLHPVTTSTSFKAPSRGFPLLLTASPALLKYNDVTTGPNRQGLTFLIFIVHMAIKKYYRLTQTVPDCNEFGVKTDVTAYVAVCFSRGRLFDKSFWNQKQITSTNRYENNNNNNKTEIKSEHKKQLESEH